ncbi:hypothetical protein DXG03_009723 [Asterophora parasitica]|uniref:Uncharacterized protein n=1 Tax=Asterophora parasitica TaxID=117018 RepID=A0A9P7G546_9AGAR|nr:hypothetical protein DXG03_009723 [Asterophora parasitica]
MSLPKLQIPPSAVFIYENPIDDELRESLSPTSSIKGVFVRSRPTSADYSGYEYGGIGDIAGPSPITSSDESTASFPDTDTILARWARRQAQADARSLAPSTFTIGSRMRAVRRDVDSDAITIHAVAHNEVVAEAEKSARRRTWPSYRAIRQTVSNILHRKDAPTCVAVKGGNFASSSVGPATNLDVPTERIKSSSTSLFSRRRRRRATTDADKKKAKVAPVIAPRASSMDALAYRAQLRRSRSFSGFTSVLGAINDEADDDDELDDATAEARQLVAAIGRSWAFEEMAEDDREDGTARFVFERSVQ